MPYTKKEKKLFSALRSKYGAKKGEQVYHAMANSGKHNKLFGTRTRAKIRARIRKSLKSAKLG